LDAALAEHRRLGNTHDAATTLRYIARLDLNVGRLDSALRASEQSVAIFNGLHDPNCSARTTLVRGEVLHAIGDHRLALRYAEEATAIQGRLGFHHNRAMALWVTGRCREALGDREGALRAYIEGVHAIAE